MKLTFNMQRLFGIYLQRGKAELEGLKPSTFCEGGRHFILFQYEIPVRSVKQKERENKKSPVHRRLFREIAMKVDFLWKFSYCQKEDTTRWRELFDRKYLMENVKIQFLGL